MRLTLETKETGENGHMRPIGKWRCGDCTLERQSVRFPRDWHIERVPEHRKDKTSAKALCQDCYDVDLYGPCACCCYEAPIDLYVKQTKITVPLVLAIPGSDQGADRNQTHVGTIARTRGTAGLAD